MPGRAPFEIGIGGPLDGSKRIDRDLWNFVLEKLEVARVAQLGIARKMRPRVVARAEAVH